MYSQEIINTLISTIGWSAESDLPIVLLPETINSGAIRKYNFFHGLISLSNLFYTVDSELMEDIKFNNFIKELIGNCAISAVSSVLDRHSDYDAKNSYDSTIQEKLVLFQDVLGYMVAIKCMEIYMSSSRSNAVERNAKLSFQNLKIELEGLKNENGHQVSTGLRQQLNKVIKDAQKAIFPYSPTVEAIDFW